MSWMNDVQENVTNAAAHQAAAEARKIAAAKAEAAARAQAQKSKVAQEVIASQRAGGRETMRPLYTRFTFNGSSAIAVNTEINLFNKGIGDSLAVNFDQDTATTGNATRLHTNLLQEGRLSQGEYFLCHGLEIVLPDNIALADARSLANVEVAWAEGGGNRRLILGRLKDFPQQTGLTYLLAPTSTAAAVRFTGRPYFQKKPLFDIKGGVAKHDQGTLILKFYEAFTPSVDFAIDIQLHGVYHQVLANQ